MRNPVRSEADAFHIVVGSGVVIVASVVAGALVSPVPGTTRDYLTKRLVLSGSIVELIDTAGWQDAASTIEEQAQRLGRDEAARADLLLW